MSELIKKIESMISLEENNASGLSSSVEGLSNVLVQEILRSIAHDSRKHAGLYTAILSLLKSESKALTNQEYNSLESIIKKHIEVESTMMEEVKKLLESELDSRINHIMIDIYEDEVKHHALMKHLLKAIIRKEAILEEDVWDMVWSDVPGHGAPIG
ncbi:MAG: hypothetical protein L6N96_06830 [Candidatus Methylarchaceae archaeon HK02M2]|nr:hypothetical protein [Candidatus Methylarchaceae archaeon HK02M2]